eukprot:TRINITY_DN1447_c0_g2_i5.p1 TRINITY_DN1447_c0_g2~~TRINITY_DN1447_c0_g2_i5.p1  ORF type:complete len:925 (+),score=112.97 TRINITY_DN1447_c0_g2_i5:99-2873(+)
MSRAAGVEPALSWEAERAAIRHIMDTTQMKAGTKYYVIVKRWWDLWQAYVSYDTDLATTGPPASMRPAAIVNSELLTREDIPASAGEHASSSNMVTEEEGKDNAEHQANSDKVKMEEEEDEEKKVLDDDDSKKDATLRRDILVNVDFVLVPQEAGDLLFKWYGCDTKIKRKVIVVGVYRKPVVELWPLKVFTVKDQRTAPAPHMIDMAYTPKRHTFSRTAHVKEVKYIAGVVYGLPPHKVKVLVGDRDITAATETLEELGIVDRQTIVIRSPDTLADDSINYQRFGGVGFRSYTPYVAVTHTLGMPIAKGTTGLYNLGNTCFMNSALQCLLMTPQLLRYFIQDLYLADINQSNPMSTKGALAKQFGQLMKQLWGGKYTIIVPRDFKNTLGRFAPQFLGYQQQDAQEFLAYVLDGIHEDLNQSYSKSSGAPAAISSPDASVTHSDIISIVPDQPTVQQPISDEAKASSAWSTYSARNQSQIVDTFQGQFKSTVVCQTCGSASTTFDPFMFLSLPVPAKDRRLVEVVLFPMASAPIKYGVRVPKGGNMQIVKEELAKMLGNSFSSSQLLLTDIYSSRAFIQENSKPLYDVRSTDVLYAYEVLRPSDAIAVSFERREKNPVPTKQQPSVQLEDNDPTIRVVGYNDPQDMNGVAPSSISEQGPVLSEKEPMVIDEKSADAEIVSELKYYSKEVNRIANVHCLNRRTFGYSPEVFGKPAIISFDRFVTTRAQIYTYVEDRIRLYLAPTELPSGLVKLKLVGLLGEDVGEPFPNDDTLVTQILDESISALSIDWDKDVLYSLGIHSRREEFQRHESLKLTPDDHELVVSLHDCLDLYTREELLEESDKWHCNVCNCYRTAQKRIQIWRAPPVLIIHLKRFQYTRAFREKLTTLVQFPHTDFNLAPYLGAPSTTSTYELFAISVHMSKPLP